MYVPVTQHCKMTHHLRPNSLSTNSVEGRKVITISADHAVSDELKSQQDFPKHWKNIVDVSILCLLQSSPNLLTLGTESGQLPNTVSIMSDL